MRYSTVSLQSLQRKSDGKGSIKEEDLPTVNDSVKSTSSILFPGGFSLAAALPLSLNITPDLSQTPSEH